MARKRIIYQSEALYAGTTGANGATGSASDIHQLHRIQDVSHSVDVARQDINEFGKLAALSREVIEPPTVGLDFTYYLVDGYNESGLGFSVRDWTASADTSAISGMMTTGTDNTSEKNYYILTVPEGEDASKGTDGYYVTQGSQNGVIGVGNGYITSYTVDASVGDIPSASVSVEASNLRFDVGSSGFARPSINTTDGTAQGGTCVLPVSTTGILSAAALRPGDVTITFGTTDLQMGGAVLPGFTRADETNTGSANVQNFSIDLPLGRTPLQRMGNIFPFSRELDFPITPSLSVTANLTEISEGTLRDLLCNDAVKRDIIMTMKNKCAEGTSIVYQFKGATLDSQNMSSTIGDNKSVDLTFSCQVGGPSDNANGVFISGYTGVVNP